MNDGSYRNYLLVVLLILLSFSSVDSLALGLVSQDIKRDLLLSDTQLGLLTGIAFGLFYSVMGIPLARWADRGNRVTIISITISLWGVGVALLGSVSSFVQLLLLRIGVAVGDAGCMPTANSLIADYFCRAERPRAASLYFLGGPLSLLIGYFVAGWFNEYFGWRVTFVILGLSGFLLAGLVFFTLKEPRLEQLNSGGMNSHDSLPVPDANTAAPSQGQPSLKDVFTIFLKNRTLRNLLLSNSVMSFFGYASMQWLPAFFMRTYRLGTGELGTWFLTVLGVSGAVAMYIGGELASRVAPNNERLQLKATAIAYVVSGILLVCVYLAPNFYAAFAMLSLSTLAVAAATGPLFALVQTLAPAGGRAQSVAVFNLCANLLGLGLGPLVVGILSDALRPVAGEESLRYALLVTCPGTLWGAWHIWRASRTVAGDFEALGTDHEQASSAAFSENVSERTLVI